MAKDKYKCSICGAKLGIEDYYLMAYFYRITGLCKNCDKKTKNYGKEVIQNEQNDR